MYPCLYDKQTYGTSITGISSKISDDVPVAILVNNTEEADIREDVPPEKFEATIIIDDEKANSDTKYTVYRFDGLKSFPKSVNDFDKASFIYAEIPSGVFKDPNTFVSNTSVMYRVQRIS